MQREKMTWKQWCSGLFLVAAAVLLVVLSWHWAAKNYYLVSLIVLTGGMGAFFLSFEREKPPAQELVLLAVLCAVTVAGRMVFAAVPFFKPGDGADYPGRCSLWRPGGVPVRGHEPVCQQLLLWPRGVDAMADVCLRPGGTAGRSDLPAGKDAPEAHPDGPVWGSLCAVSRGAAAGHQHAVPDGRPG